MGVSYKKCTLVEADDNKPWCSTRVDKDGNHVSGGNHYGNCGPECPGMPDTAGKERVVKQTFVLT